MLFANYPKTYRENLEWRRKILRKARMDSSFRAKVKELFHRDVLFAFNAFFYTLDVRKRPFHHQPFCTYEYQDKLILELVERINRGEDVPVEKSRDMGVSWIAILVFLWFWLNPDGGTDFLLGSRIEDYVDKKGDMRTLLEKARYALRRLPSWLLPKGFVWKKHDNFMRLQNPETEASITGESNNANFSTGGRYAAVLFDEFAKWESTDVAAWTAAGDATLCRIPVSTPFGAAGKHYDIVTDPTKRKLHLHWSLHPEKALGAYCSWPRRKENEDLEGEALERLIRSPWYDKQCQRRTSLEVAQELDIDYIGSGNPAFDGKAGKRIGTLLKTVREPLAYKDFSLGGLELLDIDSVRDPEGFLLIFREPNPSTSYVLGVDVAEGKEDGDFAVVKVLNRVTKDVDATYHSRINEVELAKIIKLISDYYTTFEAPWVGIETIGPGLATFDLCAEIHDLSANLFMMPVFDSARQVVLHKKGWRTTESSRKVLVAGAKGWLIEGRGWADPRLCREMRTFVINKNGKPEAKTGANDDEVLAFGVAIQTDLIAPQEDYVVPEEKREDGLPVSVLHPKPVGESLSLQERCTICALKKQTERGNLAQFGSIDPLNEPIEYGWTN